MLKTCTVVLALAFAASCLAFTTGCGGTVGGSRRFPVSLQSHPDGAIVYLVPWDDWIAYRKRSGLGDDEIMHDKAFLASHRLPGVLTPTETRRTGRSYVMVVEKNGQFERSQRFTFGRDKVVRVQIPDAAP